MTTFRAHPLSTALVMLCLGLLGAGCGSEAAPGERAAQATDRPESVGDGETGSDEAPARSTADGSAGDRPLLSETIRAVLEDGGAEAATARFEEIYPDRVDEYEVDVERMGEMGGEYMAAGEYEKGGAVMTMVSELARADLMAAMPEGMADAMEAAERRREAEEAEERQARAERTERRTRGREPLPDAVVRRFSGVYGDPQETDSSRRFFLAPDPCGGAMMFGAMWGDAANSYLRVEAETVLVQPDEWTGPGTDRPLRIEATLGSDGRAESLTHNQDWFGSPLVRTGELPESWEDAVCTRG